MADINAGLNRNVTGTRFDDTIHLNGRGTAYGRGGNDTIFDGTGNNKIYGQDGNDDITSEGGNDSVWGGRGDDAIDAIYSRSVRAYGEAGNDGISGSFGNDFLDGGAGNDWLGTWGGRDTVRGGAGDDTLVFFDEEDTTAIGVSNFSGGAGYDTLVANVHGKGVPYVDISITGESRGVLGYATGTEHENFETKVTFTGMNSFVTAGSEATPLVYHGGDSDNTVIGSFQDDTFIGGQGSEAFTGVDGSDAFVFDFRPFDPTHPNDLPMGHDVITDFNLNPEWGVDTLSFRGGEGQFTTAVVEHDGITTYTSTDIDGHTLHVLDVIGLPPMPPDVIA